MRDLEGRSNRDFQRPSRRQKRSTCFDIRHHLGNIAMLTGRKLKWNPEQFINDTTANQMLSRPMRSPWRL
ncbi:MAG: hypothetical protein ACYSU3_11040 [Planctomycetota bacterium]